MKKLLLFTIVIAFFLTSSLTYANLITNGSFEDLDGPGIGNFKTVYSDVNPDDIPGWTVVDWNYEDGETSSVDWIENYWVASDGRRSIDLAGYYASGIIITSFDTTAGAWYEVTFDMAGNPDKNYEKALVSVAIDISLDISLGVPELFTFNQALGTKEDMGWQTHSFLFQAAGPTTTLAFGDVTNGSNPEAWGAAIDNVSVNPVPEPATMLLLGSGLVGLAGFRRKFKK